MAKAQSRSPTSGNPNPEVVALPKKPGWAWSSPGSDLEAPIHFQVLGGWGGPERKAAMRD